MAVLKDSIESFANTTMKKSIWRIFSDDPAVYATLQQADTIGCSSGKPRAMACLPRLRPKRFYDIVVQVAIIRPGPIVGADGESISFAPPGREEVTYPHPSLEPVLARTLGVPLFQEHCCASQ